MNCARACRIVHPPEVSKTPTKGSDGSFRDHFNIVEPLDTLHCQCFCWLFAWRIAQSSCDKRMGKGM